MNSSLQPATFRRRLLAWYDRHGRKDLPWQKNRSAYRVWLSEIMLQQTQVATVIPYYQRFLKQFPSLKALAAADIDSVLAHWSGLGYYARARNLHKAANIIVSQHSGRFPRTMDSALSLPGIGRSTAGAVLAFSFNQRHPILDGNVKRVLARMLKLQQWTGSTSAQEELWSWAERLTPEKRVADYTQAIMDLGATVCTRSNPDCEQCPVATLCQAMRSDAVTHFPVPRPKKPRPMRSTALLMIMNDSGEVLLHQRPPTGIWGGLWSFPEIENMNKTGEAKTWAQKHLGLDVKPGKQWSEFIHRFSHYDLKITPLPAKLLGASGIIMETQPAVWYKPEHERDRGLAQPVERLLSELRNQSWHEW